MGDNNNNKRKNEKNEKKDNNNNNKKSKLDIVYIDLSKELERLNENIHLGISRERFNDIIRYCIFHILPADIFHYVKVDQDYLINNNNNDDINVTKLSNIPEYVTLFQTIQLNYLYFQNIIKKYCKTIYKKHPGENVYSVSCSCINYKVLEENHKIELVPNQLILWKSENEFYICPNAREEWREMKSKIENENFMETDIQYPYKFRFKIPNITDEITTEIEEIQFTSQIIYYLMHFILDYTQDKNMIDLVVNWLDQEKKSNDFNILVESIIQHEKIKHFYNTFQKIYLKTIVIP